MASRIARHTSSLLKKCSTKTSPLQAARHSSALSYKQALLNLPATRVSVLNNGMRVASEDSGEKIATVGLYINSGSRFENEHNNGVANFFEHMAFKGTNKRSQTDLELEIQSMGAQLGAHTSREQTVFYAKCLSRDVPRAVEILSDIVQNSKLGEAEIEHERGVILQKLQDAESNMQEVVMDHLHATAFMGTPLGQSVLGPTKNVQKISRQDLVDYLNLHYAAPRMVLAGAGGVEHTQLAELAEKHFTGLQTGDTGAEPLDYCRFTGAEVRVRDDYMPLAYVALAVQGCGWENPDHIPLMVANAVNGSWDRSSWGGVQTGLPLARACAEAGLATSFQSFNTCYSDTGLWGVYFVGDRMKLRDLSWQIREEWVRLCENVTDFEVARAKNQLRTNLLLQLEDTSAVCDDIGRQMLCYGRRVPFSELDARIEAVDANMLRHVCAKYIFDACPVQAGVGPIEAMEDYNNLRKGLSWNRV